MDMGGCKMSKRNNKNIPSEEDFQRAELADRERQRGLSQIRDCILNCFSKYGVHEAFVFYSPQKNTFRAYIFFRWDRQVKEAEESGLTSIIKDTIFNELDYVGRGNRDTIKVDFEFDSHENVEQNFDGDYYNRLR